MAVHPSSLTDVVESLESERDNLRKRLGCVRAYATSRTEYCEARVKYLDQPLDHPEQVERSTELAVLLAVLAMLDDDASPA